MLYISFMYHFLNNKTLNTEMRAPCIGLLGFFPFSFPSFQRYHSLKYGQERYFYLIKGIYLLCVMLTCSGRYIQCRHAHVFMFCREYPWMDYVVCWNPDRKANRMIFKVSGILWFLSVILWLFHVSLYIYLITTLIQ